MNKSRIIVALLFVSLIFFVVPARAWNPNGVWVNLDQSGGIVQRVEISYPVIHGYGQCISAPCDWGNAVYTSLVASAHSIADADRDAYMAIWIFAAKVTIGVISPHPENPNYIIMKTYDLYDLMGDPRPNMHSTEYLKRQ